MTLKFISTIISALILFHSLIFQVSVQELVLCVGGNGHFTIERIIHKSYFVEKTADNFATILFESISCHDEHHDDCIDISISNPDIRKTTIQKRTINNQIKYFCTHATFDQNYKKITKNQVTFQHRTSKVFSTTAEINSYLLI